MGLVIPGKKGPSSWVRRRQLELGIWRPVLPGIYWAGAGAPSIADRARAALLWAGPDALLAGTTAAHLHQFEAHWPALPITILVPPKRRLRASRDVEVIRAVLEPRDVSRVGRWPCTSPVRTLVDCAASAGAEPLAAALDFAWRGDRHLPSEVLWRLGRGLKGGSVLREVVFDALRRRRPLRSLLELLFWRLLVAHGLPLPRVDVPIQDEHGVMYLDFVYPLRGLVIETDGRRFHGADRFESDRLRDQRLAAMGFIVFKVTFKQLKEDPAGVVRRLKALLARCPESRRQPVIAERFETPFAP